MLDEKGAQFRHKMGGLSGRAFRRQILEEFHFDYSLGTREDIDLLGRIGKAGLLGPTVIEALGVRHLPHTLVELRRQRQWQGRTCLLWLRKHHSIKDFLVLSPAAPFTLLLGHLIGFLFDRASVVLAFAVAFCAIPLVFFFTSPVKDSDRFIYLVFVRFFYSSLCFSLGLAQAIVQLVLTRRIDR